jgi:hypothetical protein
VVVSAWTRDRWTLAIAPRGADTFVRAPVPYRSRAAERGAVTFHGAFAQSRVQRDHLHLVQTWLWQSGDRWLAYYVRTIARCGSRNDFVLAAAYEGKPSASSIEFTPAGHRGLDSFRIRPPAPASTRIEGRIFFRGTPFETVALERRAVLRAPILESAPLTDLATTTAWLETISKGHFMSLQAACPPGGGDAEPLR